MATSTPDPTEAAGQPRQEKLDTIAAQVTAIDTLIGLARQRLRVVDGDMSQMGWNSAARIDNLTALLRRSREVKVQIIVHEVRYLETSCPRLVGLLRQWSAAITIYRTGAEARGVANPLVIADDRHFLHRFHVDHPRALLAIDEPALATPLVRRFEEIWATGEPGLSATVLGL